MEHLISVIIPCFGQASYLPACIASLRVQTYPRWEAIIVNDGSPDATREVAAQLQAGDARVRYVEKPNGGLSSARNFGLSFVAGEFIQFLDADDLLPPEKFASAIALLCKHPEFCAVYGDYVFLGENGQTITNRLSSPALQTTDPRLELLLRWEIDLSIPVHSFLLRTSVWNAARLRFDENLSNHEDWDMWMQLLKLQPRLARMEGCTAIYRINPGSMSRNRERMGRGFLAAIDKHLRDPTNSAQIRAALKAKHSLTEQFYGWGLRARLARLLNRPAVRRNLTWRLPAGTQSRLGLVVSRRFEQTMLTHGPRSTPT